MLKNSNTKVMSNNIRINWEIIDFLNDKDSLIYSFFQQTEPLRQKYLLSVINSFEETDHYWTNQFQDNYVSDCFQGTTGYSVVSNSFSPTYSLNLDTITPDSILIQTSCWIKGSDSELKFVISVESEKSLLVYHAIDLNKQIIENTSWNHVYNYLYYDNSADLKSAIMKVYIWNAGKNNILIDDFNVNLSIEPHDVY